MFLRLKWPSFTAVQIKKNQGFGLVEVMIAAGLLAIIAVGMTSLISNMQKEQRRNVLMQILTSKKILFENAISNPSSWANTLAANGGVSGDNTHCLVNQTTCVAPAVVTWTGSYALTYESLVLRDGTGSGGAVFYDGTGVDGSKQGFTEAGLPCNTFTTAASGNDACPIGYRVSWAPHSSAVTNPKITVYVKMIFNPSDANPFKTFLNATAGSTTINSKYDVEVDRTATSTSKSFFVAYNRSVAAGVTATECSTGGYGTCDTGSFTNIGATVTILSDPFALLDPLVTTAASFKFPGTYKCNAKSYAFATNGAYLQLYRANNTPAPAVMAGPVSTFASGANYGYSTLIIDSVIQITQANTEIVMQQKCESVPTSGSDGTIAQCALGFSQAPYLPSLAEVATLNCVLID